MLLPRASLEHWMREYYFESEIDLGSSGVSTYTFGELRNILSLDDKELNEICFDDSLTKGSDGLRLAIANRWGDGDLSKVMTANGSNEMLFHIMSTMLEKDDEVVLLYPIYHALSAVAEAKGCKVKYWKMQPENDFSVDIRDLESLVTKKTKMVAVNFPHNPTGRSITKEEQDELIKIVSKVDSYLVWDAAFEDIVEGKPLPNPSLKYNKAISVGTLSKAYGLPGLRVGWCFAPSDIIESCVDLRDYTTLYISPLVEYVAQKSIDNIDLLLNPKMDDARANLNLLKSWVEENKSNVRWSNPDGGVSSFVKLKGVGDTESFCREFAAESGVMIVPGKCFNFEEYVRLGFGARKEEFNVGMKLLNDHLLKRYW